MDDFPYISAAFIQKNNDYLALIEALKLAFAGNAITIPDRLHYEFGATENSTGSTLLVMPAWQNGKHLGIKLVTINPRNRDLDIPSIQGTYFLMDTRDGTTLAIMEGKALTLKRTAAASALASSFLSRPDSETLLMIGTGALAPELILAHAAVRPIRKVLIWGRNYENAQRLARAFPKKDIEIKVLKNIREGIGKADIISTATLSPSPLVLGMDLVEGQHLDLVGSYKPDMRESDDLAVRRSEIFVDTYEGALREGGDLYLPLKDGIITRKDIRSDLGELCSGLNPGRASEKSITLFKSVGYALEDLVAASYFYQLYQEYEGLS